ncbi:MAG: ATP-binding cassette domain-containing protein [Acidimicrobiales bacterium]|nr:ATP-binding cassette domain-containing protein [Acidimicrobiales bacterium]
MTGDTGQGDAIISATGLVRRFGDLVAVDGVDLAVRRGEVFGFLGPNGAGKSTTVRMLTTLLRPSGGTARVAGHDVVSEAGEVRRRIGVALQDAAIDPLMTGTELVRLQAVLFGIPNSIAQKRGADLLDRVGLTAAADRRVGTYSGGMRRRLDLALSLVHEPEVLFLDEPTTGLDPMSRMALWEEVRYLNRERGTTVLLTTQYLEEADQLAGRIAIIDHGRIVKKGVPRALKDEVGSPTLMIEVDADQRVAAEVLARYGTERTVDSGMLGIGLEGGAQQLTSVVRALDDAGITVVHMELNAPTLDDVFAEATGRRLEGADETESDVDAPPPTPDRTEDDPSAVTEGQSGDEPPRRRRRSAPLRAS